MPSAKYLLQLPFRKVYVLPSSSVNEYAWKPDAEISTWAAAMLLSQA